MMKMSNEPVGSRVFVDTLRRFSDGLAKMEPFRIQAANKRFIVPGDTTRSIQREASDAKDELEFQVCS